jgi:broad specificity phosphatase PhoE
MDIIYFVHGTTTDNELDLATGWADCELSELGIQQAKQLNQQAGNPHFDAVFCSNLKRAKDTANCAFGDQHFIIEDKRLREANYGDLTQQPSDSVKENIAQYVHTPFPNGESYKDVEKRMNEFLNYLKPKFMGKSVALIAHQAPQLALDVLIAGKTWEQAFAEDWRHTKAWQPGWTYTVK